MLAVCFTLSDQSIEGAANVARQISRRYRDRKIRVLPVPMRIEDGEKEKLDIGRALARMKFEGFPAGLTQEESALHWASVEVPYKPFYAFEETLATFGDDPGSPASLLASFERITDAVTGGQVTAMRPIPEELRLQYKEAFSRRQPTALTPGLRELRPGGPHVGRLDRGRADPRELPRNTPQHRDSGALAGGDATAQYERELQSAPRAIAVLSSAYMHSPGARSIWKALSAADAAGMHRQLIPIRVSDVRVTEPFTDYPMVDLARLDAAQATARLLWALDRPVQATASAAAQAGGPRFPGTIPPIWNVPARNADFTGRGATLEKLRDKLAGGGVAVVVAQALYGLGGVGKTQLALEYAHRFMADYDLVWWVPSERAEEISLGARGAGPQDGPAGRRQRGRGGRGCPGGTAPATPARTGCSSSTTPMIPSSWSRTCPTGAGHVLITSRNQAWTPRRRAAGGGRLHQGRKRGAPTAPRARARPGRRVRGRRGPRPPAAGGRAGRRVAGADRDARPRLRRTAGDGVHPDPRAEPAVGLPDARGGDLEPVLRPAQERSPAAVRLLQILAFCSPGPISMDLLYSDEMNESLLPFDETLSEKLMLGRVIRDVSRFALIKVDQGSNSLQIHRLVQAVIRSQMTEEEQQEARHEVHKILVGARPRQGETDDPANWSTYDIIWPHLGPSQAEECDDLQDSPAAHRLGALPVEARRVRVRAHPGQPAADPVDPATGPRSPADIALAVPDRQRAAVSGPLQRSQGAGHVRP